jgi:hypothetical protein
MVAMDHFLGALVAEGGRSAALCSSTTEVLDVVTVSGVLVLKSHAP